MMRKRIQITLLVIGCWIPVGGVHAQVNSDSLIQAYTRKLSNYLDKENVAKDFFLFTKTGIDIYAPPTDTTPMKFDFSIYWDEIDVFRNMILSLDSRTVAGICVGKKDSFSEVIKTQYAVSPINKQAPQTSLAGLKIALDPGHIAGDIETAKMEKKWVEMKKHSVKGVKEPIQLIEGELTLATAKILRKKLESAGAKVMMTRNRPNISAFGVDFKRWKDSLFVQSVGNAYTIGDITFEEKNFLLMKAKPIEIFRRFFLQEEMRERVRKINEFHPDLTLIIHYNVDETNVNWNKPSKKNFVMSFVGGSFAKDEFEKPEARIEFLRLLLTDDIERSVDFSKYIVNNLSEKLNVPAAMDSSAIYLYDNCMKTDVDGVFCRNLTLTRMVKGVLVYGEALYQDNINECKLLNKKEITINGMQTSKRVEQVAEAYYEGIVNYIINKSQ